MDEKKQLNWQVKKKCGNRIVKVILERIQVWVQKANFQETDSSLKLSPASENHVRNLRGAGSSKPSSESVPRRNRPQRNKTKIYTQFFDGGDDDEDSNDGNEMEKNTPTSDPEQNEAANCEFRPPLLNKTKRRKLPNSNDKKPSTNLRSKPDDSQTSRNRRKRYWDVKMTCDLCKVTVCRSKIWRHYRRKHPNEKVPKKPPPPSRDKNIIRKKTFKQELILTCDFCPLSLPSTSLWKHLQRKHGEHLSKGDPSRTVQCDLCPLVLREEKLYMHKKTQHSYKQVNTKTILCLQCDLCSCKYTTQKGLETHIIKMHVVDKPWECLICYKSFLTETRLQKHVKLSHEDKTFRSCRFCPTKSFKDSACLKKHIQLVHKGYTDNCDTESTGSNHLCPVCDTWFLAHSDLVQHFKKPKSKSVMKCEICSEPVHTSCLLNLHRQQTHSDTPIADVSNNNNCQIAEAIDSANVELGTTTKSDTTTKTGDPASAKNPSALPSNQFSCLVCSALFSRRCDLDLHELQEKHRRWKCPVCSKLFYKIRELKIHIQSVHSDARPFGCTHEGCRKSFSMMRMLKIHMATHTTDRVHCKECSRYFAPEKFEAHVANYHRGKDKFKCDVCNSTWATQKRLESHAVTHTDERPWPCKFCDAAYKCSGEANRHMKRCEFMSEEQRKKCSRVRIHALQAARKRKKLIPCNSKKSIGKAGKLYSTLAPESTAKSNSTNDLNAISSLSEANLKVIKQEKDSIDYENVSIIYELPVKDVVPVKFEKIPKQEISSD